MLREAAGGRVLSGGGGPETLEGIWAEDLGGVVWTGNGARLGAETGAPSRRRVPEEDWAGWGGTAETWNPSGGQEAQWGEPAAGAAAERRAAAEPAGVRRAKEGSAAGGRGLAAGGAGRGDPLFRVLPWGEGWTSAALRAEDGANALSRAVQRDARRYDGGFAIY